MSRHAIPGLRPGLTVVVGWDNPLSTYFAQVSRDDADDEEDAFLLWLGTEPNEVPTPQDLIMPLTPYAVVTEATVEQLRSDRAACLDRAPTTLQRTLLNAVRRQR